MLTLANPKVCNFRKIACNDFLFFNGISAILVDRGIKRAKIQILDFFTFLDLVVHFNIIWFFLQRKIFEDLTFLAGLGNEHNRCVLVLFQKVFKIMLPNVDIFHTQRLNVLSLF